MFKDTKISVRLGYIVIGLIIIVLSFLLASLYIEGEIVVPEAPTSIFFESTGADTFSLVLHDLSVNGATYTAESNDPFIEVNFKKPQKINEIRFNLLVTDADNITNLQVFFQKDETGFSEENSVSMSVSSGEYIVTLPADGEYIRLRLDITNEQETSVTINSVQFFYEGTLNRILPVFFACVIYMCVGFVMVVLKKAGRICERKFCLTVLLLSIALTVCVVFMKMYSSGNMYAYIDIGADTSTAYIPEYTYISDRLRNGDFELWSGEYGYGGSIFSVRYDPLMLCVIIFTTLCGNTFLIPCLVAHKICCVLLSGYFCYKFLCLFSNEYSLAGIAAYLYAFNGFGNVWGQHYFFSAYPVFTIIVFYAVERYLRAENPKFNFFLILVSGVCMASSVYPCYMIYFTVAVYALIRYIYMTDKFKFRDFTIKFGGLLANVVIGFGVGTFMALPCVEMILNSERVTGGDFLQKIIQASSVNWLEPWWNVTRYMLTGFQTVYYLNYYEDPQLFFSVISVFLLLQFLFTINKVYKGIRKKICVYLSVALVLLAMYNGIIPLALNAFVAVSYRGLYVLFPLAALQVLSSLDNICNKKIFSPAAAVIACVISAISLQAPGTWLSAEGDKDMIKLCTILLILAVILLVRLYMTKNRRYVIVVLCGTLVFNCVTELHVTMNRNGILTKDQYKVWQANSSETVTILAHINGTDDDYYRIDKTYNDFNLFTDSLLENYKGVTLYNSTMNGHLSKLFLYYFRAQYCPAPATQVYERSPNELVQWSMTGLRYILSKHELYDTEHFIPMEEHNGIILYRLSESNSFGTFYTKAVSFNEFSGLDYGNKTKVLQNSVILEEDFAESPYGVTVSEAVIALGERDITRDLFPGKSLVTAMNEDGQREVFLPENWAEGIEGEIFIEYSFLANQNLSASMAVDNGNGYISVATTSIPADTTVSERFTLPRSAKSIRFDLQEGVMMNNLSVTVTEAPLRPNETNAVIKDTGSDSHLTADINCPVNGLLFMPIPFDKGWSAYVDGAEAEIILANSGFMAVDLTAGEHRVEFVYRNKSLVYGIVISAGSCVIALLFWYWEKRRNKAKNEKGSVKEK